MARSAACKVGGGGVLRTMVVCAAVAAGWTCAQAAKADRIEATEPEAARAEAAGPADGCGEGAWRLDGASSSPNEDGTATYVEAWDAVLDEVVACLAAPEAAYACIEIQGQFDDRIFSHAVVTAFGSLEAAQHARARGRANAVQLRLEEKGISPGRLRQRSPGREATFRGAMLRVVPDCLPRPPEMSEEDRRAIAEARAILENPPTRVVEVVREVPGSGLDLPLYLEAGLHGGMGLTEGEASFGSLFHLGLGARMHRAYGRLEGQLATETEQARRGGLGVRLAGGAALLSWLDLGLVAGMQWSSVGLFEPWLERTLLFGLEGRECLLDMGEWGRLCLRQSLYPLGSVARRATLRDGVLETHPETTAGFFGADVGVLVDFSL